MYLRLGVAKVGQVLDAVQHRALVRERGVQEVLFALKNTPTEWGG
jgi:hypothetical protein